jgi:hypothetical protein
MGCVWGILQQSLATGLPQNNLVLQSLDDTWFSLGYPALKGFLMFVSLGKQWVQPQCRQRKSTESFTTVLH